MNGRRRLIYRTSLIYLVSYSHVGYSLYFRLISFGQICLMSLNEFKIFFKTKDM